MVISGGEHKEWPSEEYLFDIERRIRVLEYNQEHEEATWEWLLEQGPPRDDDIKWLKDRAALLGGQAGEAHAAGNYKEKDRLLDILHNEL